MTKAAGLGSGSPGEFIHPCAKMQFCCGCVEDVNGAPKSQRLGGSKSQRPKWYVYVNRPQAGCPCGFCGLRDPSQVSLGRCSSLRF
jgi:hypothetical protein